MRAAEMKVNGDEKKRRRGKKKKIETQNGKKHETALVLFLHLLTRRVRRRECRRRSRRMGAGFCIEILAICLVAGASEPWRAGVISPALRRRWRYRCMLRLLLFLCFYLVFALFFSGAFQTTLQALPSRPARRAGASSSISSRFLSSSRWRFFARLFSSLNFAEQTVNPRRP